MNYNKKVWTRSLASVKTMMLLALLVAPLGAMAQNDADSYPIETVKWDKVPAENREVIELLFADMTLVPEGEGVKKFYISAREVKKGLWDALTNGVDAADESAAEASASFSAIEKFITLLRKQTGKRFRLPTEAERLQAVAVQAIDEAYDATDTIGKGFHLALDTLAKAEQKMLVITATDGTTTKYLLEGMPQVKIEKPYLVISSGYASVSIPLERLQHMHYEKATDEATAIGEIVVPGETIGREHIDFSNLPAGAAVSIYTLDGKQLYSAKAAPGKSLSLPLGSLQSGIYLVKVNDVTYKIQKP